jgi:YhcH/YjgK/YiaL family protein
MKGKIMPMLGTIDGLTPLVHPGSRLKRGLVLLQDCVTGRLPEIMNQLSILAPGETRKISLDGDALYIIVQCYAPRTREQGRFEAHERYTDLQFLWSGRECIEVCDVRSQPNMPRYDSQGNVYFPLGNQAHSRLLLHAGEVAVLLPEDAHAACLSLGGEGEELVRKIVVKIRDAHLPVSGAEADSPGAAAFEPAVAGLNK